MSLQYTCDINSYDYIEQEQVSFDQEDAFVILLDQQYEDVQGTDFPPFYSFPNDRLPPSSQRKSQVYPNGLYDFYMRNGGIVNKGPCYLRETVRQSVSTRNYDNAYSFNFRKIVLIPSVLSGVSCSGKDKDGILHPTCKFDDDGFIKDDSNNLIVEGKGYKINGVSSPYTIFRLNSFGGPIGITSGSVQRILTQTSEKVWIAKPVFINTGSFVPKIRVNGIRKEVLVTGGDHGQKSSSLRIYCLQSASDVFRNGMVTIDTRRDMLKTAQQIAIEMNLNDPIEPLDDDSNIHYQDKANGFIYDSDNVVYVYDNNSKNYINYRPNRN